MLMTNMPLFTLRCCFIVVSSGGRSAAIYIQLRASGLGYETLKKKRKKITRSGMSRYPNAEKKEFKKKCSNMKRYPNDSRIHDSTGQSLFTGSPSCAFVPRSDWPWRDNQRRSGRGRCAVKQITPRIRRPFRGARPDASGLADASLIKKIAGSVFRLLREQGSKI